MLLFVPGSRLSVFKCSFLFSLFLLVETAQTIPLLSNNDSLLVLQNYYRLTVRTGFSPKDFGVTSSFTKCRCPFSCTSCFSPVIGVSWAFLGTTLKLYLDFSQWQANSFCVTLQNATLSFIHICLTSFNVTTRRLLNVIDTSTQWYSQISRHLGAWRNKYWWMFYECVQWLQTSESICFPFDPVLRWTGDQG